LAAANREYELVLMLDPRQDAPSRDKLAGEARAQIAAAGTLKHENDWGLRKMAYEIGRRNEADYRWFRFEAPTELLGQLDHNLKIADGVLRFRIFKVDPDSPVIVPPAAAASGPGRDRAPHAEPAAEAEPAAQPAAEPEPAAQPGAEAPADAAPPAAQEPTPEAAPESTVSEAPAPAADAPAEVTAPAAEPAE
jgi:small subunit ribosomal protein S6